MIPIDASWRAPANGDNHIGTSTAAL